MWHLGDARRAFDPYARLEPRLEALWDLCREAGPPARELDPDEDFPDDEPTTLPGDWCAEDFFFWNVKSRLLLLVGRDRHAGPPALQTAEAYDAVYDLLMNGALKRTCACCAEVAEDEARPEAG